MTNGHKVENRVQKGLTDGHKSWNNRIWHRNWIQSKMTDCHKGWNTSWDTNWDKHWIQNKLTGGHYIWSRNWQNDRVRNKLTSQTIESVGQAVGVRSHRRCRQITLRIDTAACRTVVPARHPATRGDRCHLGRGSRSTVLDGWQVCCVGRGSTFACVQRYRRQTHDD